MIKNKVMAQYIDAVVAEINRQIELLKPYLGACAGQIVAEANAKLSVLEDLKKFLDTIEVKEVDLEKEYKDFLKCDDGRSMFETAKHFFALVSGKIITKK